MDSTEKIVNLNAEQHNWKLIFVFDWSTEFNQIKQWVYFISFMLLSLNAPARACVNVWARIAFMWCIKRFYFSFIGRAYLLVNKLSRVKNLGLCRVIQHRLECVERDSKIKKKLTLIVVIKTTVIKKIPLK